MEITSAKREQGLKLQLGPHAVARSMVLPKKRQQIAQIFAQQAGFAVGQVVRRKLNQVASGKVGIHRAGGKFVKRVSAKPGCPAIDERSRQHGDSLAAALTVIEKGCVVR